ncbi:MAG: hypothetical protein K2V38_29185 [Gemmataceae bacterium]|nr:hypothetical protein [Gemmataceae bacterium]
MLLVGLVGGAPPTVTEGTFDESYELGIQRGSMDVKVETSGPATYKIPSYPMERPTGPRPDTEAAFVTPAGTFKVSNRKLQEPGISVNGTFYPEPPRANGLARLVVDRQGAVTVHPAPPDPAPEGR